MENLRTRSRLNIDLVFFAILLLAGWKYSFGLENWLDIGLADESAYLFRGASAWRDGLPSAENAPLYALWYLFLAWLEPNRVALYYLNYTLLTFLPPLALYVLLRRYAVTPLISLATAFFLLISAANFLTWPKVNHLALLLIFCVLIGMSFLRCPVRRFTIAAGSALLCAYIRPEFFLAFIILLIAVLGATLLDLKRRQFHNLTFVLVMLISLGALLLWWGIPVGSGNRSFVAFGQHFALNWLTWTSSDLSPWTDWQAIIAQNFGNSRSAWEAIRSNPVLFIEHVVFNMQRIPRLLINAFFVHPALLLPESLRRYETYVLIVAVIIYLGTTWRNWIAYCKGGYKTYGCELVIYGCYILPALLASVVIFPRQHYMLTWAVLVGTLLAISIFHKNTQRVEFSLPHLIAGLLVIAITPSASSFFNSQLQPNKATIQFIASLDIEQQVQLLEAEGGYHYYLSDNFERVVQYEKEDHFGAFYDEYDINMIVLSEGLQRDSRFRDDQEWHTFLNTYPEMGYTMIEIPKTNRQLLLDQDLLR
jgi:hypothetical protein